ncbi:peptidoglycan bridge formation glycyltransferase FemA/FemB family protein [Candidatus Gottesmanbacteria bacterium]|nr:peptidoglycan bridge formation glycyltransferase FemA/FemB family protein [Candidatus Gottesmanbacteria bacterium]
MEIREITDKYIWEKFISESSPQSLFQSWNWGETIKKFQISILRLRSGQELKMKNLWRLGLYEKGKLIGIAQVQKVVARRGTFLHIRHGPIFKVWTKKYLNFLLDFLRQLSREQKVSFIRISPLIENSDKNKAFFQNLGFIDAPIHRMDGEYCWVLDIDRDESTILSGMRKTTRYLIRQAQKMNVEIVKSKNSKDLDEFITLYEHTAARHHFVKHKGIIEEFNRLMDDNQILLFKGYYQKKLLAGALIVFYNHQAIYHHSASEEGKIPVNYLLQWEAVKEAKKRGKTLYNFWGIAPEGNNRHPWRGLTLFKKGFGGRMIEYLHAKDLPLSTSYCATYLVEWFRKVLKGY